MGCQCLKSNGRSGQLDIVKQIIEAGCVVTVGEHEIRLTPPARSKIAHLFERPKDSDNLTPEESEFFSIHNTVVEAVKACIPGLRSSDAEQFVSLAGGYYSDLAEKAMQLCGMGIAIEHARGTIDKAMNAADEQPDSGGEADPTIV